MEQMKAPTLLWSWGSKEVGGPHRVQVFLGGPDPTLYTSTIKAPCTLLPSRGGGFASLQCPVVPTEGRCLKTLSTDKDNQAQKGIVTYARSQSL